MPCRAPAAPAAATAPGPVSLARAVVPGRAVHMTRRPQVAARALQLHPTEAGLWAQAAAWEWEASSDASAARALMQRGLRACPQAMSLWVDYFRLELLYAAKLAARRRVLGLPLPGGVGRVCVCACARVCVYVCVCV